MNLWRRSLTCRLVARLLPILFLSPLAMAFVPSPAQAAGATITGAIPVAVVDFRNETNIGGSMLGRRAADAVAVALSMTDRFEVAKRSEVENQMAALGMTPPLDAVALMRLGTALQEDSIISGRVISASIGSAPRQAKVTLAVEMRDVTSGELVNGAMASGTSGIGTEGVDDDALLDEALNKAAYVAQKTMLEYILPQGTVLATTVTMGGNEVLLNIGQRSGVRPGMEMIVNRGGEQVGRIRVKSVTPTDATAVIIQAPKGVRPEDKVRAIFELPKSSPKEGKTMVSSAPRKSRLSGLGKMIAGLAVLVGLVALADSGDSSGSTRDASAVAAYDIEPMVQLEWRNPKGVTADNGALVEYQIWRHDVQNFPVAAVQMNSFLDTMAVRTVRYHTVDDNLGPGSTGEDLNEEEEADIPGIQPGRTYNYWISAIFKTIGQDDQGNTITLYKIGSRVACGQVTPIERPDLVKPVAEADANFNSVNFEWGSVQGADAYQVQVAADPSFTGSNVWVSPTVRSNPTAGQIISLPQPVSLSRFAGNQYVYWRVGARRDSDTFKPVGNKGWVFSEYRRLKNIENPPPPPN